MSDQPKSPSRRFTGKRATVVRKLWRTAEAQVSEIEQRLAGDERQIGEQERDARTLAVLAKTLRDLVALDDAKSARTTGNSAPHDDAIPRDVDALRRSLAQKVEALIAEQRSDFADETDRG